MDLANEEAVRAAAAAFLDDLNAGRIDPKTLGGLSREDILGIIDGSIDHIDALGQSARNATREIANMPRGFRQAALAFQAQDPASRWPRSTPRLISSGFLESPGMVPHCPSCWRP